MFIYALTNTESVTEESQLIHNDLRYVISMFVDLDSIVLVKKKIKNIIALVEVLVVLHLLFFTVT